MSDVLERILAYKREDVARGKATASVSDLDRQAALQAPPRGFAQALARAAGDNGVGLIAEIKKASPSKGLIRAAFDPATLAAAYQAGGAACLSVLTDGPSFMGGSEDLAAARQACRLPALRKDFLVDPWQVAESRALGADAILIILAAVDDVLAQELAAAACERAMDVLVECHDAAEVARAARLPAGMIGINNRNLRTFETDLAVTERLAGLAPRNRLLVSESGIHGPGDVARVAAAGASAILVGESLMRQTDVTAATKALLARLT